MATRVCFGGGAEAHPPAVPVAPSGEAAGLEAGSGRIAEREARVKDFEEFNVSPNCFQFEFEFEFEFECESG